ncbi:MAG: hypothetical protein IKH57_01440 [Clostridia bacterium]|nr:hypothetical protein [Clostridia bacterium]
MASRQMEVNAHIRKQAFEPAVKHNVDLIFACVCVFETRVERKAEAKPGLKII